jgi:hypothetical protein
MLDRKGTGGQQERRISCLRRNCKGAGDDQTLITTNNEQHTQEESSV